MKRSKTLQNAPKFLSYTPPRSVDTLPAEDVRMKLFRFSALLGTAVYGTVACGGNGPALQPRPAIGNVAFGTPTEQKRPEVSSGELLPAEVQLGPYTLALNASSGYGYFGHFGWHGAVPQQLEDGSLAVLSFGRRVTVNGKTARIIDRGPNPQFDVMMPVPASSGGGFLFVANTTVRYAPRFDAEPIDLPVRDFSRDQQVMFGGQSVLFADTQRMGEDDDRPENYTYISLANGRALSLGLLEVQQLVGTTDGRSAAINQVGELFFSGQPGAPWRKVAVPRVRHLQSVGNEIQVHDENGPYALDPNQTRAQMPPVSASPQPPPQPSAANASVNVHSLRARRLEENVLLFPQGEMLTVVDRLGNENGQSYRVAGAALPPGAQPSIWRNCAFVTDNGPFLLGCQGQRQGGDSTYSFHLFDPKTRVSKLERGITMSRESGPLNVAESMSGQVTAYMGRCNGTQDGTSVCVRSPTAVYKDVDMRKVLNQSGLLPPNLAPMYLRYAAMQQKLIVADDGISVGVLAATQNNNAELVIALSDGRSRSVPLSALPKRLRTLRPSYFHQGSGSDVWLTSDGVVGLLAPAQVYARNETQKRSAPRALAFRIPMSGEITATSFDGYLGQYGTRVLRISADGAGLEESVDAGQTFRSVAAPPGLRADPKFHKPDNEDFCAETVCKIGPWLRMGWGK
jgi:hypothetical protein